MLTTHVRHKIYIPRLPKTRRWKGSLSKVDKGKITCIEVCRNIYFSL